MRRLRRLQAALLPLPATTRQGELVAVSAARSLIYFSLVLHSESEFFAAEGNEVDSASRDGDLSMGQRVTLGIGLEWERGVVTGVVIRHELRHVDPDSFLSLIMFSGRLERFLHVHTVLLSASEAHEANLSGGVCTTSGDIVSICCSHPPVAASAMSGTNGTPARSNRRVRFDEVLAVVLVPIQSAREHRNNGHSDLYYSRQDFQLFGRQRNCEVADVMREEGISQAEALHHLYLLEGSAKHLFTESNSHISFFGDEDIKACREDRNDDHEGDESVEDVYVEDTFDENRAGDKCSLDLEVMKSLDDYTLQRERLRGESFSLVDYGTVKDSGQRMNSRKPCRVRSASTSICCSKDDSLGTNLCWRNLRDDCLLDTERLAHALQRDRIHEPFVAIDKCQVGIEQSRSGTTGRSASADGRLQTTSGNIFADVEDKDEWYPGKILQMLHDRAAVGTREFESVSDDSAECNDSTSSASSLSSCQPVCTDIEEEVEPSSWYIGKLIKRVMSKPTSCQDSPSSDKGWYMGKYFRKAVTPPSSPRRSHQIFNHNDSIRLSGEALSALQDATNNENQVSLGHRAGTDSESESESDSDSSLDSDSDSDTSEMGMHRHRMSKVLLPPIPTAGWLLGRTICRDVLKPSPVEVKIIVQSCRGLKSESLLPPYSPISFVEVSVGDNTPLHTNVAGRSSNPNFTNHAMNFSLSPMDTVGEYVLFTVYERFVVTGQKVPLGHAKLSLAAVPVSDCNSEHTLMTLPLVPVSSEDTVGKGLFRPVVASIDSSAFHNQRSGADRGHSEHKSYDEIMKEARIATTSGGVSSPLHGLTALSQRGSALPPTICVSICKIDPNMFTVLKQLHDEDCAREDVLAELELGKECENSHSRWIDEEPFFKQHMSQLHTF